MTDLTVTNIREAMEQIAPTRLAQQWDNVGLLCGDGQAPISRVLLCIDLTAAVLAEARRQSAQMVIAYHPVIFKPLSRVTRQGCPVVYEAIQSGLSIYSPHTALDVAASGPNDMLAQVLGLTDIETLDPAQGPAERKIITFVPESDVQAVSEATFEAGAGTIGQYEECSFRAAGTGTFQGRDGTRPAIGQAGRFEQVAELRLEMVCPADRVAQVCKAIRRAHSYEEPPVDVYPLEPKACGGLGRIGNLVAPDDLTELVTRVKQALGVHGVQLARAPGLGDGPVTRGACCAGSCGSLFRQAARRGAEVYLTGEMRHHDALAAAAAGMSVICVGHSNSERRCLPLLADMLIQRLPELEVVVSDADADPFEVV
jgi:dinuclear metal center YbgI/SA1388 family protein